MLAIVTQSGTSLIDPSKFKNPSSSFPVSSSLECATAAWSSDNSQLYLASSSSIKRYTPSESLLEVLHNGSDTISCLAVKDKKSTIFFAAANKVWSLDCAQSPGKAPSHLEPHKSPVAMISISNDCTLLASVSASAVFVHNLTLSSHTALKGLSDVKAVSCCLFHQHSRTRLLLGVGRDVVVYDSTRTSGPLKTVRIPGSSSGNLVGLAASPFSKTLIAAVTSNGDVALVDLEKESGILKTVNVKTPLTSCAFTAEGAAIYLGTKSGALMILDLRSLEKVPKSFVIGDGNSPIKEIVVQKKSSTKSSSTTTAKSSPQRSGSSTRSLSTASSTTGAGIKSPVRVTVASKIRGGGGVTPKKKLFSPVPSPLSESKNLRLDAKLANARSPTLSRRFKAFRVQGSEEEEENIQTRPRPTSPASRRSAEQGATAQRAKSSLFSDKMGMERLGVGPPPESISAHLAAMRTRSTSVLSGNSKDERPSSTARRVTSESHAGASIGRQPRRTLSLKKPDEVPTNTRRVQEQRSTTPDMHDDIVDLSSPELPREPVTPLSLAKKTAKAPAASATGTGIGVLGLSTPEVARWAKGDSRKGKEKAVEGKKTRFAPRHDAKESDRGSDHSDDEREIGEQELSMQLSPRRSAAPPPTWLPSPHRPSPASLNMNAAAQDFLRSIVHDVMYDFQREAKAEMMGLHLDLVRMGRGWRSELREIMEEWGGELKELREENKRLREENERLRRGY